MCGWPTITFLSNLSGNVAYFYDYYLRHAVNPKSFRINPTLVIVVEKVLIYKKSIEDDHIIFAVGKVHGT